MATMFASYSVFVFLVAKGAILSQLLKTKTEAQATLNGEVEVDTDVYFKQPEGFTINNQV